MRIGNLFWVIPELEEATRFYNVLFEQQGTRKDRRLSYVVQGLSLQFYALAPAEAEQYGLLGGRSQEAPRQGVTLLHDDWPTRLSELERAGGSWLTRWGRAPWGGWMAHLLDPFGYCWELSSSPQER